MRRIRQMEKYVEVRTMTEQECMDISTRLRENLVELARVLPYVDMGNTVRIESCRLMAEIATIIKTYGDGIQTPLKLGIVADRIRKPVSTLCSLLEPTPVCNANRNACILIIRVNYIIEKYILLEDSAPTLNY
jgi:hypothetical protein